MKRMNKFIKVQEKFSIARFMSAEVSRQLKNYVFILMEREREISSDGNSYYDPEFIKERRYLTLTVSACL